MDIPDKLKTNKLKAKDRRKQKGAAGEALAAQFCLAHDYVITERNWRRAAGEIDIIAKKNGVTYFIEVRSRSGTDFGTPVESIDRAKKEQIIKTASLYMAEQGRELMCEFAVAAVHLDKREVELIFDIL